MLDAHPALTVANDPHFIHYGIRGEDADVPMTAEILERVISYRTFSRLGVSVDEARLAAGRSRTYAEFVSVLFDTLAQKRGKPLAGEKTPHYVRYLPLLHALFAQARTIHIIRDGRDVALSTLGWARPDRGPGRFELWREEPVAVCALSWRWHVTTGRRDGSRLGRDLYAELLYERLVADPGATLGAVVSFLGLPFAQEMLTYHEGKLRADPELPSKDRWLPPTPGLRDWRAEMSERDVALYEAIAGDVLLSFGYERAFPRISSGIRAVAEACRTAWESELRARRRKPASRLDLAIEPTEYAVLS
jgi:hypothetical protein